MENSCFQVLILLLLMLLQMLMQSTISLRVGVGDPKVQCIEKEKHTLLKLKQGFSAPSNRLSSWAEGEDCCLWSGVGCNNETGHVTLLDLHNPYGYEYGLVGDLSPLLDLQSLTYLDLSFNHFDGTPFPDFFGSLTELRHLNLSNVGFYGSVSNHIGNLSKLQSLDLNDLNRQTLHVYSLDWISGLPYLRYLDMSGITFDDSVDWLNKINNLPSLNELHLENSRLGEISSCPPTRINFTSIEVINLSHNNLATPILKPLANVISLLHLDLSYNLLECSILEILGNLTSLLYLDLSYNQLPCSFPHDLRRMTFLSHLDLSANKLEGPIPNVFRNMSSLEHLDLSGNHFSGSLPESTKQLPKLVVLNVGWNSLKGVLSDSYLLNHSKLQKLEISLNSFTCNFSPHWIPPLQLNYIGMASCALGPLFPPWLQGVKHLSYLDVSHNGIKGTIPNWFWSIASNMRYMNFSNNHIQGMFPNLSSMFLRKIDIDLSANLLDGPIPQISPNITSLSLSKNSFSGHISDLLCKGAGFNNSLKCLDLSDNLLSGKLPDCWMYWRNLYVLSLSNNSFTGEIPPSIGSMHSLLTLHLRNNNFSGRVPVSLKSCTRLYTIDVSKNSLSGEIPTWIGESLPLLQNLILRSNQFDGNIPSQLCYLKYLQVLDLSDNNIQGTIPYRLGDFTGMVIGSKHEGGYVYSEGHTYVENAIISWKAGEFELTQTFSYVCTIDLASNKLTGPIPEQVTDLVGLLALNLSRNFLTGKIPNKIGNLQMLESLDFSRNELYGVVPVELSYLNSLGFLNLSYNKLSGEIPPGHQLSTFDSFSYMGNQKLCGPPLIVKCSKIETSYPAPPLSEEENGIDIPWFYVGLGMEYIVGFWAVCGALLYNRSWRIAYFQFIDVVKDWIYVITLVHARKMQRKLGRL